MERMTLPRNAEIHACINSRSRSCPADLVEARTARVREAHSRRSTKRDLVQPVARETGTEAEGECPLYPFFGSERLLVFAHDYAAGSLQELHRHDVPQLLHAVRGVMRMTTPAGYWVIPPGQGVWIPAYLPHKIRMVDRTAMRTLYVGCPLASDLHESCAVVEVTHLLRHLLEQLAGAEPPAPEQRNRHRSMEDLVLLEIERMQRYQLHLPMPTEMRLRRLCERLLAHPDDARTLEELAVTAAASPRTLRRLFQQELGMSFVAWRQQARLVEAMARLEDGCPVAEVSQDLGYAAPSAFSAMFKRALGQSPRHYRELQVAD